MKNGAAVFKDIHESDPAKRYNMIFKGDGEDIGMAVSFSADGLNWSEVIDCPQINAHDDTFNVAFWAGYEPISPDAPAVITTKPMTGNLASLSVTADVQKEGTIYDAKGQNAR